MLAGCGLAPVKSVSCRVTDPDLAGGSYAGGCADGWAEGYGEASGAGSYRGYFHQGMKHGRGINQMPNGDVYEGVFRDDRREGRGRYVWGPGPQWAGDRYEGEFRQDLRHGQGIYQWANGDRYEGPWVQGRRMGWTVLEIRRGQVYVRYAEWMKDGTAVCAYWPDQAVVLRRVQAVISGLEPPRMTVRVLAVEGGKANHEGASLGAGAVIQTSMGEWGRCE
jgi:hypothetical protein